MGELMNIDAALRAMSKNHHAGNNVGFMIKQLELCKATNLMECRPKSLWEPAKRRAVIQGLLATEHLSGPVAEMGVFTGGGTFLLASILDAIASTRTIIAADSFEGLPVPTDNDRIPSQNNNIHYVQGMFSDTSSEMLHFMLDVWGYGERVRVVKGFFDQVLDSSGFPEGPFSMVIIDPDQYSGTKLCLEYFYPRMQPDGLIFVDDYRGTLAEGVNKAVDEFLADKAESMEQGGLTMWYLRKKH